MSKGVIFDIRELTVHDGPGVRTTVFLKGCPLRCNWCHNPEGWKTEPELMIRQAGCTECGLCKQGCNHEECKPFDRCTKICPLNLVQICGKEMGAETLANQLKKNADIFEQTGGGVTVSGGEPLMQPEFLIELLQRLSSKMPPPKILLSKSPQLQNLPPVHTAVETSGYGDKEFFKKVVKASDLLLFDVKHMDPRQHKYWTGVDNSLILENLNYLILSGKQFIARMPLIPGVNDTDDNFERMAQYLEPAKDRCVLEILPYNRLAGAKYESVSRDYTPKFRVDDNVFFDGKYFDRFGLKWRVL